MEPATTSTPPPARATRSRRLRTPPQDPKRAALHAAPQQPQPAQLQRTSSTGLLGKAVSGELSSTGSGPLTPSPDPFLCGYLSDGEPSSERMDALLHAAHLCCLRDYGGFGRLSG